MGSNRHRLCLGLWDLENAGVPKYEFDGDFLPALRHFVNSFGFNGDELSLDVYVGDETNSSRGIRDDVFQAIKSDRDVRVFSCGVDPITQKVPKQAADCAILGQRLKYLHRHGYEGLLVIIAGDADYVKLLKTIVRAKKLKVIRIYPYPPRTSLPTRKQLYLV